MKQYYAERFQWIFRYTSKNFFYCLGKTLCLIAGVPIYAVMFAVEMILTFINMIFSWIPVLNVVVGVICKAIVFVIDKTFFICILTDIGKWRAAHKKEIEYEVADSDSNSIAEENNDAEKNADSIDSEDNVDKIAQNEPADDVDKSE